MLWMILSYLQGVQKKVRDLKPNFLSPQAVVGIENFSAYHQENFLRNLKLNLTLFLLPFLRELWPFQTSTRFLGHLKVKVSISAKSALWEQKPTPTSEIA